MKLWVLSSKCSLLIRLSVMPKNSPFRDYPLSSKISMKFWAKVNVKVYVHLSSKWPCCSKRLLRLLFTLFWELALRLFHRLSQKAYYLRLTFCIQLSAPWKHSCLHSQESIWYHSWCIVHLAEWKIFPNLPT